MFKTARRINLKKMGIRGGTEIVSVIVYEGKMNVALNYKTDMPVDAWASVAASLFLSVARDAAAKYPGKEKEIFDEMKKAFLSDLQQKGLDQ